MPGFAAATRELLRRLGADVVRTDAAALDAASYDSSKIPFRPEAVIKPRREAQIGVVLALANRHRVPVTVRGRGTTLTGAAAPRRGGWVIDMLRLNRIRIDAEAGMAHVQAGAKIAPIQAAAEAAGWFYPPDPSSKAYCTIGGNVACNAGGMHGGKYGVTRDFVIALRGFAIASADRQWHWAEATIDGATVIVHCKDVPAPVAVRYAFTANPEGCNLYNNAGLPASPFRSDTW